MVQFELSDILKDKDLPTSLDDIVNLTDKISLVTSSYISNTKNQTVGITPANGLTISGLPVNDNTETVINGFINQRCRIMNDELPKIYVDNVWQILLATQTIPIGWFLKTTESAAITKYYYELLHQSFVYITLGDTMHDPLYIDMRAFGIYAARVAGHEAAIIRFFAIYDNELCYTRLTKAFSDLGISNITLMTESEYTSNLANSNIYGYSVLMQRYLVRFDKATSVYNGTIFKAKVNLVEAIPNYVLSVGCSPGSIICKDRDSRTNSPRLENIEFKQGSDVAVSVHVPSNQLIYMISLNGTSYFMNSADLELAGITVAKLPKDGQTGFDNYYITVSKLMDHTKLYIAACEDLSKTQTTKTMISNKSSLNVTSTEISINLIFNRPFIYLDTSKIKVWAKKDDVVTGEELVTCINYITTGTGYKERQAVFTERPCHNPDDYRRDPIYLKRKYLNESEYDNPNVTFGAVVYPERPICNDIKKPNIISRSFIYGVTECGSLIMTFDGYATYKYFRIEFETEAMVSSIIIPGSPTVDVIPYIESVSFTNEYCDEVVDDSEVNNDGESDNNTIPDGNLGNGLGFSYDS